jgi:hypothetical protein
MEGQAERAFDRIESIASLEEDILLPTNSWWNLVANFYRCA